MNISAIQHYHKQQFNPGLLGLIINPFYFSRKGLYKKLSKICPKLKGNVLDFGCGRKPYESLFSSANSYIGIDFENIGHSHENEKIDVYYDGKTIPFEENKFDVIFASEVFEHIENLDEIIIELKRVLKRDGFILISIPFVYMEHEMPFDFRRFSINGLVSFLERNGFYIEEKHKTTKDIETVFHVITFMIFSSYQNQNKILRMIFNILFIAIFNIFGSLFSFLLPNNERFYANCVVLARKL